jgi:hypothetical protein
LNVPYLVLPASLDPVLASVKIQSLLAVIFPPKPKNVLVSIALPQTYDGAFRQQQLYSIINTIKVHQCSQKDATCSLNNASCSLNEAKCSVNDASCPPKYANRSLNEANVVL